MVVWSHKRSPGWLVRTVCAAACLVAGGTSSAAQGIDPPAAPPLPPPTGAVVTVASVAALQAAVNALTSGTTILIQPGTYRLTETLRIRNGVTKVALRGATNNRGDVWVAHNTVIRNGTYPNAIEYRFPTTTGVHIANNLTDGAIAQRDAAQATLVANFTQATAGMFVNAASGDLHLRPTATQAIDKGVALAQVTTDWDGQARPCGAGSDIGADEVADDPGGAGPPSAPGAPRDLGVVVNGSSATFSWHAPLTGDPPTSYALLAALSPGGPPVATLALAVVTQTTVSSVPPGTYYVRLIAMNAIGTSPASNEVIASGMQAPGAPLLNAALVHGSTVTLSWAPGLGDTPSSYVISASLTASGSAIGYLPISGTSITLQAPNGTYFVRVTAMNAAGAGPWSNEISVFVQ